MGKAYEFIAKTKDGVFGVDPSQRIVLWNEAATSLLGWTAEEALGRNCYEFFGAKDAEGCPVCSPGCDAMETAKRLDLPPNEDLDIRTKGGETVWVNVSRIVLPSPEQELSVLIHLFRERGQRRELMRAVHEFTTVVSELTGGNGTDREARALKAEPCVSLTGREQEVLGHLAQGRSTEMIAEKLCISPRTVRNHVSNIIGKLKVGNRLEAVTFSIQNGLV